MNQLQKLIVFGNSKLPKWTAIFNLGPAFECPAEALGLCRLKNKCYAKKAERQYKHSREFRRRQKEYWLSTPAETFLAEFMDILSRKRTPVDALRFDESGDFWTQECVDKVDYIAEHLKPLNINTYTYTARKDLDFSNVKHAFINGTEFYSEGINNIFVPVKEFTGKNLRCLADCSVCKMCYTDLNHRTIEVIEH